MRHPPETRELARELRANGMLVREVAERIGVPKATVTRWCNPQFEKRARVAARKRRYSKKLKCPNCGKRRSNTAALCRKCYKESQRVWTRDKVIEAIQAWAVKHGHAPTHDEWSRSGKDHPATATILSGPYPVFSSWSEALIAAGFKPRVRRSSKRLTPKQRQEIRRKIREERIKKALENSDVST